MGLAGLYPVRKKLVGAVVRQALSGVRKFARNFSPVKAAVVALLMVGLASPAVANPKYAGIVVDAKTGKVLYEDNADAARFPASLTKMMTLYLTFEALETGRLSKGSKVTFSKNASAEPPTKLGVRPGQSITVEQAILGLVTKSANDAATALSELIGGSESNFAMMMTRKAHQLGMSSTTFKNAHGLPNASQKTTARDMAKLGIALREHFPQHYSYFSTRSFTYAGRTHGNHNRLLGQVKGTDGIKTGYTNASGFNLVSSVQTDGRSIVAVVLGGTTSRARDQQMAKLISRYMPNASTGRDKPLIARAAPLTTQPVMAAAQPVIQPAAQVAVASATSFLPSSAPIPAERPDELPINAYVAEQASVARDPLARIVAETAHMQVDPVHTASTAPSGGWVIQVASMPSKTEALRFLENMRAEVGPALANADPFTVLFEHKGRTYHRARFAGFNDKTAAWNACESLKKKKVQCFAVAN